MPDDKRTTVAMLAPMRPELAPLKKKIPLERVDEDGAPFTHKGAIGNVEVIAAMTGIGMTPARETTERLLDATTVDHLMVVGIAGGMGPSVNIGDLVIPEVVIDEASGSQYRPTNLGGAAARGTIVSSDRFGYSVAENTKMISEGVVALDMETAAVAEICAQRNVPWSAYRGISDRGDDETVDVAVLELGGTDGSANIGALVRYLLPKPWRIVHLARLAKGAKAATTIAADAAIGACRDHLQAAAQA